MTRTLVQLGITDRPLLVAARRRAGGDAALAETIVAGLCRFDAASSPVMLSTCERTELYMIARASEVGLVSEHFARYVDGVATLTPIEHRLGEAVVAHLFAVAAGIESRLVGEPHILGQVSRAVPCPSASGASPLLSRLFQDAVACGRHARSIVGLDRLAVSCVDLALARAQESITPGTHAAVVGSGSIAREVAARLDGLGLRVTVFARHYERVAESLPSTIAAAPLDGLRDGIALCDLLVAATSSAVPVISFSQLEGRGRPLVAIDLGMPPNVDADVRMLTGMRVITLDDLLEGEQRPERLIAHGRAIANARAARWARRWLSGAVLDVVVPVSRSTVA